MMNADDLGEKGQSRFQEVCVDSGLTANKSTRDRTGWDYIVEFPFVDGIPRSSIDSRPAPLSCHVQVKTILWKTDRITLRLSGAERLAKEIKPAFVYVLRLAEDLSFSDAVLIHLSSKPLEQILKRLRKEEAAGARSKINKKTISLSIDHGAVLAPTGLALRQALEREIGPNLHDYTVRKKAELEQLGFVGLPYKGTFTFTGISGWDELADIALGLKAKVSVADFRVYEERFGITLPVTGDESGEATITVKPHAADKCTLRVSHKSFPNPIVLEAEIIVPGIPGIPPEFRKIMITCKHFALIIGPYEHFSFVHAPDLLSQRNTADRWLDLARIYFAFASGEGHVEATPYKVPGGLGFVITEATGTGPEQCKRWLRLCETLVTVFRRIGVPSDHGIEMDEIEEHEVEIYMISDLLSGDAGHFSLVTQKHEAIDLTEVTQALWIRHIDFGSYVLAYSATSGVDFEDRGDRVLWRSTAASAGPVRFLPASAEHWHAFVERVKEDTGITTVIEQDAPASPTAMVSSAA